MAQAHSIIEIGVSKCSHFDTRTKFLSSLNTCISHMKHSIALMFSMVAPYLLDMNFTNLERKHCFQKKVILLQSTHQRQNCKKHAILWWKNGLVRLCFQQKFFWEWKEFFSKYLHTKIQLCSETVKG